MFQLHELLERDALFITDLPLCRALLMNNSLFPWLVLVPRIENAREIIDLPESERYRLMAEISKASFTLKELFNPHKINVASLGNMVPQLHVHIIARFTDDPAWPEPVWGKGQDSYHHPKELIEKLRATLTK
jgi:diadenosine tetraphosphate (Ap4A) HIT family hydrolase